MSNIFLPVDYGIFTSQNMIYLVIKLSRRNNDPGNNYANSILTGVGLYDF